MAINSISQLSSFPHYWVVAGLSWWVLPCCCSAVLLTSEQVVAASSAALRRCSFDHLRRCACSCGCDHTCTFCAIPSMRGRNRSKPIEVLVEEAESLAAFLCNKIEHLFLDN